MTTGRVMGILTALGVLALVVWVARHTYWGEMNVPMPLQGEAFRNPVYAAERLVEALGATARRGASLDTIDTDAVIVLYDFAWDVSSRRRADLEHWVESGGRLLVDQTLVNGGDSFETWSGVTRVQEPQDSDDDESDSFGEPLPDQDCPVLVEAGGTGLVGQGPLYSICSLDPTSWLGARRRPTWQLQDDIGPQVVRLAVGLGSVTVVNGAPFTYRELLQADHAELLVAATQLHAGDEVVFMSEDDHDSLLTLAWSFGAPVVALFALLVALSLWRGMQRFGPLATVQDSSRRSLTEQVRGTGRFTLRWGGGAALHAAARRALAEAAARRVAGYERMSDPERIDALGPLTATDETALARAMHFSNDRSFDLLGALALLESVRRQILTRSERSHHGKRS